MQLAQDSRPIGLVVDDLANPFFSALARSVEDEAYRRGLINRVTDASELAFPLRLSERSPSCSLTARGAALAYRAK